MGLGPVKIIAHQASDGPRPKRGHEEELATPFEAGRRYPPQPGVEEAIHGDRPIIHPKGEPGRDLEVQVRIPVRKQSILLFYLRPPIHLEPSGARANEGTNRTDGSISPAARREKSAETLSPAFLSVEPEGILPVQPRGPSARRRRKPEPPPALPGRSGPRTPPAGISPAW